MLFSVFLVCSFNLAIAAVLLLGFGRRVRHASRVAGLSLAAAGTFGAGYLAALTWSLRAGPVEGAEVFVFLVAAAVVATRRVWNPLGQYFFGAFVAAAFAYLAFAADVTVAGNLSLLGSVASALLFLLELVALLIACTFAFETCDVVCRVHHSRIFPAPEPTYRPMVSLHIAAYNEPPDMLIETIRAAEALDYPDFEIVVIDNNTDDEEVWRPVEAYCAGRPRVTFVHVNPWPGYKSGALNLALHRYTDPRAEIVGVIDSDYLVDPSWLQRTVGYFAHPEMAFVQTPQDYREYEGNRYLTACYDAYRYFFASAMPSRNERNSIIFAGTMGLLRRRALESLGGWDEWCITEDAETSLRLLQAGYSGFFVARSFGRGIMPLTFASLKSQRFRWCFGGMQILRRHWRSLMPWDRSSDNHLSISQRLDYLVGGVQWLNDLVLFGFTLVLLVVSALLLGGESVAIRPLIGPTILLPAMLLVVGLLRAVWALRDRTGISLVRALFAFANWLSLSWTVALACLQGLIRQEGVFLRTPKVEGERRLLAAVLAARTEILLSVLLWGSAGALAATTGATPLLIGLVSWQGSVYASAPLMAWLEERGHLTPELERRRRSEERRERLAAIAKPVAFGSVGMVLAGVVAFVVLVAFGASHAGHPGNPFAVEQPASTGPGPWGVGTVSQGSSSPTSTAASAGSSATNPTSTTTTTSPGSNTSASGVAGSTTTTAPASSRTTTTTSPARATTTTTSTTTATTAPTTTTTTAPTTTTATTTSP